jgi:hypothetical protein
MQRSDTRSKVRSSSIIYYLRQLLPHHGESHEVCAQCVTRAAFASLSHSELTILFIYEIPPPCFTDPLALIGLAGRTGIGCLDSILRTEYMQATIPVSYSWRHTAITGLRAYRCLTRVKQCREF